MVKRGMDYRQRLLVWHGIDQLKEQIVAVVSAVGLACASLTACAATHTHQELDADGAAWPVKELQHASRQHSVAKPRPASVWADLETLRACLHPHGCMYSLVRASTDSLTSEARLALH